jgi:hypothetical protein
LAGGSLTTAALASDAVESFGKAAFFGESGCLCGDLAV